MRHQVELTIHPERRWYAVMTQPQREALAWQHLCDRDFEVFLPEVVSRVGHPKRSTETAKAPLFPGYLFLHASEATEWHRVTETPCVIGMVTEGERPLPARAGQVEKLLRLAVEGDGTIWADSAGELHPGPLPKQKKRACPYKSNAALRIVGGPFSGFVGQYVVGSWPQPKLWLDIMGRTMQLPVSEAQLQPV